MNVIVPVGFLPPDRTAASTSVMVEPPSVAVVGFGVATMVGVALATQTFTLWEALAVVPVVFVVRVAVLL